MVLARKKAVGTDFIPQTSTVQAKEKKLKKSRKPNWLLKTIPSVSIIVLIFLISFSLVAQHVWINYLGYQISQLKNDISNVKESNEKLKLNIAKMSDLVRIEKIAINDLGMIKANSARYIFLNEKKIVEAEVKKSKEVMVSSVTEKNTKNNTWLGSMHDFIYYWLTGESDV